MIGYEIPFKRSLTLYQEVIYHYSYRNRLVIYRLLFFTTGI